MPGFSDRSKRNLSECDERLQKVFSEAIKYFDCVVICGHRSKAEQNEAFRSGKSKLRFPQSKHNRMPSLAADVMPYPIDWNDRERMTLFAGRVLGIAQMMGVTLRWGGDWDRDTEVRDNRFDDLVHFEIVE